MNPKFKKWHTIVDESLPLAEYQRRTAESIKYFTELALDRYGDTEDNLNKMSITNNILISELVWQKYGRPYYKVWPHMTDMLASTSLNFNGQLFRRPYKVFAIMLPLEQFKNPTCLVNISAGNELQIIPRDKNIQIQLEREKEFGPLIYQILFMWLDSDTRYFKMSLRLHENITVEQALNESLEYNQSNNDDETMIDLNQSELNQIIRVGIGVCMFATYQHSQQYMKLDADLPQEKQKSTKQRVLQQIISKKISKSCKGWRVGSEICLPTNTYHHNQCQHSNGELNYAHPRSGHMRLQAYGKGRSERKLIFIHPTIIRPDLPMKPSRGYKI